MKFQVTHVTPVTSVRGKQKSNVTIYHWLQSKHYQYKDNL
jgi:hypothetical protein